MNEKSWEQIGSHRPRPEEQEV